MKSKRPRFRILAQVSFVNKAPRLLVEVRTTLADLGFRYGYYPQQDRETFEIRVSGHRQVFRLLKFLRPLLVGRKAALAEAVSEFCGRERNPRRGYNDRDFDLLNRVLALNAKGTRRIPRVHSPTTVRLALQASVGVGALSHRAEKENHTDCD